ncbi:MAG: hypothetical protein ACUVRH_05220 [Candidatus Bipolaricaulia bacterium]
MARVKPVLGPALALVLLCGLTVAVGAAQAGGKETEGAKELLDQILAFLYSIAHGLGQLVIKAIQLILPEAESALSSLIDPIGFLALLTIFLALFSFARGLVWIVIIVGWALIIVRIVLAVLKVSGVAV